MGWIIWTLTLISIIIRAGVVAREVTPDVSPCCLLCELFLRSSMPEQTCSVPATGGLHVDSLLLLQPFPKKCCFFSLSLQPTFFHYLVRLAVCGGSLISLPLLSPFLSVQACQWSLICRTLHLPSTLLHTAFWDRYDHIQAHMHMDEHAHIHLLTLSDDVSFTLILPLFPAEWKTGLLPVKQPTKWQYHPHSETMFYLIVSIWLLMHIIQYMQHMEQDGWSDYKRIHGLTCISCFRLVQIFSHFLSTLEKDYFYFFYNWNRSSYSSSTLLHSHTHSSSLCSPFCPQPVAGSK